ncbi:LppU/SCO3897 family protein [Virgisporangium ochraceum]|uniref:Uncharacterized protein n=1 Tax=Virgisporangium ochraceum TaxID=65505 RepID=A0A8J4EBN7_9ACTN|nr:hypothetical protein [Virgisporangium ochraceum]GIJ68784.1 hypothetical protein Voc01_037010 [Virgisporangium ochraceum]
MSMDPFDPQLYVRQRPPRPPSRFRRRIGDVAIRIAAAVAVLACCGGLNALFNDDDDEKERRTSAGASTPSPTRPSPPPTSYSPPPTPTRSVAPPPSPSTNPLDAVDKGDCLKNTGTDYDPDMVPVACGPGTYQVLRRIYGTIDANQCQSVSGATTTYTVTYYRNNIPQYGQSYVFCLKKR